MEHSRNISGNMQQEHKLNNKISGSNFLNRHKSRYSSATSWQCLNIKAQKSILI